MVNFLPKHLCASSSSLFWGTLVFLAAEADGSEMSQRVLKSDPWNSDQTRVWAKLPFRGVTSPPGFVLLLKRLK